MSDVTEEVKILVNSLIARLDMMDASIAKVAKRVDANELTMEDIRKMSVTEIMARQGEVDAVMEASGKAGKAAGKDGDK